MTTYKKFRPGRSLAWRFLELLVVPLIGALISVEFGDWTWFSRSGSIMVAISIFGFALAYIMDGQTTLYRYLRENSKPDALTEEELVKSSHGVTIERYQKSSVRYIASAGGAIIGTVIWGFGDLVGGFV